MALGTDTELGWCASCGSAAHLIDDHDGLVFECLNHTCQNSKGETRGYMEEPPRWFEDARTSMWTVTMDTCDEQTLSPGRLAAKRLHSIARGMCESGARDDVVERDTLAIAAKLYKHYTAHVACAWESRILVVTIERTEK